MRFRNHAGLIAAMSGAVLMSVSALAAPPTPVGRRALDVQDWGYQLQGYNLGKVRDSRFDLLVIDYSTTGDASGELTAAQVRMLQMGGPCGRRLVLAYMSIGEAEDYRFYWDNAWVDAKGNPTGVAPAWLGPTNPDWPGNYKVRYWQRPWQRLIYGTRSGAAESYLDRIIDAGFDGVYLDVVDAFEYWGPREIEGNDQRRKAPADMVRFVKRLARYARNKRRLPDFFVVPQNGSGIIHQDSYPDAANPAKEAAKQRKRYFRVIDAIGAEDTFYFGGHDENNPLRPQNYVIKQLDQFVAAGKPVLAIDYLTKKSLINGFWKRATARGYVPYTTVRDLDRLMIPAGHAPVCH